MRRKLNIPLWLFALVAVVVSAGCGAVAIKAYNGPSPGDARKAAVENRAVRLIPDPGSEMQNFPIRRALKEMTVREDKVNHPWYVYVLGDNGNTIGYYVSKFPPINACDFLSSTQDVYHGDGGDLLVQSPSYDGVYYGQSKCDVWVIFDYATNAEIKVGGLKFYTADQPLKLNVTAIKVG